MDDEYAVWDQLFPPERRASEYEGMTRRAAEDLAEGNGINSVRVDDWDLEERPMFTLDLRPGRLNLRYASVLQSFVMDRRDVFDSPEEAALDGWPIAARVRVISEEIRGNRAEVVVDTDPTYPYWVYCQRSGKGWRLTVDGNGPCVGWDDPTTIQWAGRQKDL